MGESSSPTELLKGQSLPHRFPGKPLELDAVLHLGIQIADALHAAYSKGIFHPDGKPPNIFVTNRGAGEDSRIELGKVSLGPRQVEDGLAGIESLE